LKKVRTETLSEFKRQGQKFSCLTSYDFISAEIFDQAGIDVILVGDSAADNVLGYESTIPVTLAEMASLARAVSSAAQRALVVVDMPFGSYEISSEQALENAIELVKSSGAEAVKLEGGIRSAEQIARISTAGIPVMGHIGFTPQSVNSLGGYRVQGRGDSAAQALIADARAVEAAGAFAVVLEMVPAALAAQISSELSIPTIGIGAGSGTDAQILVWSDMAGYSSGKTRKFVKRYADLRSELLNAAKNYDAEVKTGKFPDTEHSFE
jgi:3-methyl-2-oxobutanoate hydroxymethyltransferase